MFLAAAIEGQPRKKGGGGVGLCCAPSFTLEKPLVATSCGAGACHRVAFFHSFRSVLAKARLIYHPAPRLTAACAAPAAGVPSAQGRYAPPGFGGRSFR